MQPLKKLRSPYGKANPGPNADNAQKVDKTTVFTAKMASFNVRMALFWKVV